VRQLGCAPGGIPSCWIVEPNRDRPRLIVFELSDEGFRAEHAFPVMIPPSALVRTDPLDWRHPAGMTGVTPRSGRCSLRTNW
jgi:hypothetical protein